MTARLHSRWQLLPGDQATWNLRTQPSWRIEGATKYMSCDREHHIAWTQIDIQNKFTVLQKGCQLVCREVESVLR